jgi:hypothetical protein
LTDVAFEEEVFMFPRFLILAAVALSVALAGRAEAAKVVGKVVVTEQFRRALADAELKSQAGAKSGYWNEPNAVRDIDPPAVAPDADLGIALILEGAPAPKAGEPVEANIRAGNLEKRVIIVRPGTNVKFRSIDPFDHELYVPNMDWFPPEKQSRGAFRMIEFAKEGIFEVRCRLMPHMKAWIVVTPATYILSADANGSFSVDGLQPGKYTIRVFHNGAWLADQKLEIANERGDVPVEVKLDVPSAAPPAAAAPAPTDKAAAEPKKQHKNR